MSDTTAPHVPTLEVENLVVDFDTPRGTLRAVNGVSFSLAKQEAIGIVGESGSGKSVLARTLLDLLAGNGTRTGTIRIGGRDIDKLTKAERKHFFGVEVAMVFQDPMTSLNPVKRIGAQITESIRYHLGASRAEADKRAIELLEQVHIPSAKKRLRQYPQELSGGMRQRVVIAMALACEPKLLIADEPTTALDVTVQKTILDLIDGLREERHMSLILITHDLGVTRGRTDRIGVMYAGRLVEQAPAVDLFNDMRHPYTEALLESIPNTNMPSHTRLRPIPGRPPDLLSPPPGCPYAPRCRSAQPDCLEAMPQLVEGLEGHLYACHHPVGTTRGEAARAANLAAGHTATGLPVTADLEEVG